MKQFTIDPHGTETSGRSIDVRFLELTRQRWNRSKSAALAQSEGIYLNDDHWAVIVFLRKYYLKHGLPINARTTATALNKKFAAKGGSKYLYRLFRRGPVTQATRLANLRSPAYTTDPSFGTSY